MKRLLWRVAASDTVLLMAELILIIVTSIQPLFLLPTVAVDLFAISPLKAGIALLCETGAADPENAKLHLLFRYYSHGYIKSVVWRILLWIRITGIALLSAIPVILLSILQGTAKNDSLLMLFFVLIRYFLVGCGAVMVAIQLIRLSPSAFLLPYVSTARQAFDLCRRLFKKKTGNLLENVKFLLFPPYYQMKQASFCHCILRHFRKKKLL